jgi:hypothetical protein
MTTLISFLNHIHLLFTALIPFPLILTCCLLPFVVSSSPAISASSIITKSQVRKTYPYILGSLTEISRLFALKDLIIDLNPFFQLSQFEEKV